MGFWDERLAPPAPAQPQGSLGDQYRAWQRGKMGGNGSSGSAIYAERPTGPAARPDLYAGSTPYGGLESYAGGKADTLARRQGESTESWRRRILAVARALPAEEVEQRLAAVDQAEGQGKTVGHPSERAESLGIMGASPADRAQLVGGRGFGGRQVEANGHVHTGSLAAQHPASISEISQELRLREQAMRGQQPQRQEIPTGSSGQGIFIR